MKEVGRKFNLLDQHQDLDTLTYAEEQYYGYKAKADVYNNLAKQWKKKVEKEKRAKRIIKGQY